MRFLLITVLFLGVVNYSMIVFAKTPFLEKQRYFILKGNTELKANEEFDIIPKEPLPVHDMGSRICFIIGNIPWRGVDYTDTVAVQEEMKNRAIDQLVLIESIFGKQDYELFNFDNPLFIKGQAYDQDGKFYNLSGKRFDTYRISENIDVAVKKLDVAICSVLSEYLNAYPLKIVKFSFTPLKSFNAKEIYWSTSEKNSFFQIHDEAIKKALDNGNMVEWRRLQEDIIERRN